MNLPAAEKWVAPRYQDIKRDRVTLLSTPDGGALVRVIAGDIGGGQGPGVTHTPIALAHATVAPGAALELPWPADFNALVYVLNGKGAVGAARQPIVSGQLAVLGAGDSVRIAADAVQESRSPRSTCCSWVAAPSASRSPGTARS